MVLQWYIAVGKLSSCPKSNATCPTNVPACNEEILDAGITKSICSFILIVVSFLLMVTPSFTCLTFPNSFCSQSRVSGAFACPDKVLPIIEVIVFAVALPYCSSNCGSSCNPKQIETLLLRAVESSVASW